MRKEKLLKTVKLYVVGILLVTFTILPIKLTRSFSEIGVDVSAIDTIAGYSTLITAKSAPNIDIEIAVEKPDRSILTLESRTDEEGSSEIDLYSYHTKQAGIYKISSRQINAEQYSSIKTFRVYPGEISITRSSVNLNTLTVLANGINYTTLTIKLVDQFGNPISGHSAQVISSRNEDSISRTSRPFTDQLGIMTYNISSMKPGVSIIRVSDETADKILENIARLAFIDNTKDNYYIGGESDIRLIAQAESVISNDNRLLIENIPAEVELDKPIQFTIKALNENKEVNTNYTGTIHFSTTDPNAIIPDDYSFIDTDLGQHTFSLSLKFLTPGVQKFSVLDVDNEEIKGEITVNITGSGLQRNTPISSESNIQLTLPKSGSTKDQKIFVEGKGPNLSDIFLFDFETELGKTSSDSAGVFKFTTNTLQDGKHQIFATLKDTSGKILSTSNKIDLNIDITPPVIDALEFEPQGDVQPSQTVKAKLFSEARLSKVSMMMNNQNWNMEVEKKSTSAYLASFKAPKEIGDYPIDFILMDELGNMATYLKYATLTVSAKGEKRAPDEPNTNPKNDTFYPSKVTGISADSVDDKVTLTWEASLDDQGINNYRIYYGLSENKLDTIVNTFDSSTTWYIPNLSAGKIYYFAMTAIDTDFNESLEKSAIIFATVPEKKGDSQFKLPEPQPEVPKQPESDNTRETETYQPPEEQPSTGNATAYIILASIIFTEIYIKVRKKFR